VRVLPNTTGCDAGNVKVSDHRMRTRVPTSRASIRIRISIFDSLWAIIAPLLALYFGSALILKIESTPEVLLYCALSGVFAIISFVLFRVHNGLSRYFSVHDTLEILKATIFSQLLTTVALFTLNRLDGIPRSTPIYQAVILAAGLIVIRIIAQSFQNGGAAISRNGGRENIIIIGATHLSSLYVKLLEAVWQGQRQVIALLDDRPQLIGRSLAGIQVLGPPNQLRSVIDEFGVHGIRSDRVIIGSETTSLAEDELKEIRQVCDDYEIKMDFIKDLVGLGELPPAMADEKYETVPLTTPKSELSRYLKFRSIFDFIAAFTLLVILSPLLVIGAILVLMDIGPPVYFWQQRIGQNGRRFLLYKFRTMSAPYDRHGEPILDRGKLTFIRRLMRQTRLDELPQLFNVLVGDMALIGPRPLLPGDQPADPSNRLKMRPGMTGWAQVNGGKFLTPQEKDRYDEYYIRNASLWLDLRILLMTLRVLFRFTVHSDDDVAGDDRAAFDRASGPTSDFAHARRAETRVRTREVSSPPIGVAAPVISSRIPAFLDRTTKSQTG
jgi:lipopolysaccharide/colanic/teichoic acid biosynthesis glycosyltransferase